MSTDSDDSDDNMNVYQYPRLVEELRLYQPAYLRDFFQLILKHRPPGHQDNVAFTLRLKEIEESGRDGFQLSLYNFNLSGLKITVTQPQEHIQIDNNSNVEHTDCLKITAWHVLRGAVRANETYTGVFQRVSYPDFLAHLLEMFLFKLYFRVMSLQFVLEEGRHPQNEQALNKLITDRREEIMIGVIHFQTSDITRLHLVGPMSSFARLPVNLFVESTAEERKCDFLKHGQLVDNLVDYWADKILFKGKVNFGEHQLSRLVECCEHVEFKDVQIFKASKICKMSRLLSTTRAILNRRNGLKLIFAFPNGGAATRVRQWLVRDGFDVSDGPDDELWFCRFNQMTNSCFMIRWKPAPETDTVLVMMMAEKAGNINFIWHDPTYSIIPKFPIPREVYFNVNDRVRRQEEERMPEPMPVPQEEQKTIVEHSTTDIVSEEEPMEH